jgi:hypothetical protein
MLVIPFLQYELLARTITGSPVRLLIEFMRDTNVAFVQTLSLMRSRRFGNGAKLNALGALTCVDTFYG